MCQQEMTTQPIGSHLSRELLVKQERKLISNKNIKFFDFRWKNQARGNIEQGLLDVFYKTCEEYDFWYPITPMIF